MIIPKEKAKLLPLCQSLLEQCRFSMPERRALYQTFQTLYYMGSINGTPSKYNKCYTHIDKLSSYIFSAASVRFSIDFPGSSLPAHRDFVSEANSYLARRFRQGALGPAFSMANLLSLVDGASHVRLRWTKNGLRAFPVRSAFFGVQREDLNSLDDQEAFIHTYFVTEDGFRRLVQNHPDKSAIALAASFVSGREADTELLGGSYIREIVAGGTSPIGYSGGLQAAPSMGAVPIVGPPLPNLPPEVTARLIQVFDIWIWNDEAKWSDQHGQHVGDWTTIRYVDPGLIVEGDLRHQNLGDVPGRHPFVKVCSNEVAGYYWGRSEMAQLAEPQKQLTQRTQDIDSIWRLRAAPPRAFLGQQGITEEKARALLAPGGYFTDSAIGSKVENLAPEMPPEALALLEKYSEIFDEVGGFTNILSGQGEPGVRAGVHAGTLLRTSTPRLRDRALLVEMQVGEFATKALLSTIAKDPTLVIPRGDLKKASTLATAIPPNVEVTVDSHTSSPAFVDDERQLATLLAKADVISGETLIRMVHPPNEDKLVEEFREKQEAMAAAAAANPTAAEASKDKKK